MNKSFRKQIKEEQWEHTQSYMKGLYRHDVWCYVIQTVRDGMFLTGLHMPAEIKVVDGVVRSVGYLDKNSQWQYYPFNNVSKLSLNDAKHYLEVMMRMEGY